MKNLLYIDESEFEAAAFKLKMEQLNAFDVEYILVVDGMTLDDLIEEIHTKRFDCMIVDYFLRQETVSITYQGDDVARAFNLRHPGFPLLMLTNDDDNAIDAVTNFDVRNIRSKSLYQNESDKFIAIINKMIDDYADMATKLEEELRELRSREISGELVAAEEERLIELDELVDKNLDASTSVPRQVKKTSNTERLDSLIVRADAIIEKLGLLDTNE